MAALTEGRNYKRKFLLFSQSLKLAAVEVFEGGLVAVTDSTGYARAAADAAGITVMGIAKESVDNSGGSAGDLSVVVEKCVAGFAKDATNPPVQADVGKLVFVKDDQTVCVTAGSTNKIEAGTLLEIDDDGICWVAVGMRLAELRTDEVGATQLADDSVDTAAIQDDAVTTDKIDDDAVTAAKIADDAVDTDQIVDGAVTAAKAAVFVSSEQTGTGSSQDIAHGLGAVPAAVLVAITEFNGDDGAHDVAEGAHDGTNVKVTVTNAVKFKVLAWA